MEVPFCEIDCRIVVLIQVLVPMLFKALMDSRGAFNLRVLFEVLVIVQVAV